MVESFDMVETPYSADTPHNESPHSAYTPYSVESPSSDNPPPYYQSSESNKTYCPSKYIAVPVVAIIIMTRSCIVNMFWTESSVLYSESVLCLLTSR